VTREMDLEPHVEGYLWRNFHERFLDAEPQNFSLIVQNTARGGPPNGIWRRPDIVAAVVSRYTYSPIPQLDLFAFELKMPDGCKVYAVHEALAHTALAHFAYLVLYLPDGEADPRIGSGLRQISEQAQIHGIGLVIVTDAMNDASFQIRLRALRREPKPRRIDDFINDRFYRAHQLALQSWLH
jgi:hypothetical protein